MNPPVPPPRRNFRLLVAVLGVAAAGLFVLKLQLGSRSALADLQKEADQLRNQLESRDDTLRRLESDLRRFRQEVAAQEDRPMRDPRVDQLSVALAELSNQQSVLFTGLQSVALSLENVENRVGGNELARSPKTRDQARLGIELLRGFLAERTTERSVLQQELLVMAEELGVPADVQGLDPAQAIKMPAYRDFWPFFDLMEQFDSVKRAEDALRLRIDQEKINAELSLDGR